MDAEKLRGCQKTEATIWAFWDCVAVHLQVRWQELKEHVVSSRCRLPAQGREGDISSVLLASLMCPLYPSL